MNPSAAGLLSPLRIERSSAKAAARALGESLERDDRIQVPVGPWPVRAARDDDRLTRVTLRLSAQRYNEPEDYERLADGLRRRLGVQRAAMR